MFKWNKNGFKMKMNDKAKVDIGGTLQQIYSWTVK